MLKTMQSRLSRISKRLDEQHFHSSILDTISCMDAIISLISSVEIVLRWYHFSHVLIEIIQVGDLVFSRDDVTGESSWQPVEETFVTPETELLDLELAWPGGGETLRVTSEHPIWVKGEGWVEAGSLRSGDHIATADAGGWATVQSLRGAPGKERGRLGAGWLRLLARLSRT